MKDKMKEKMKGLVLGLTIGSLLSGSVALASGTQIEVAFRNLKYMFDGVEKVPAQGKGFIYEGSTYVPLRFVSEALGKPVEWDEVNETIWVGEYPGQVIAAYKGGKVTKGELDTYVAIHSLFGQSSADPTARSRMMNQLIAERVLSERAANVDRQAAKEAAVQQLEAMKLETYMETLLQSVKVTEEEFIQFLTVNHIIIASLTDKELKAVYEANLAANKDHHTIASVRHILVGFRDQEGQTRSKADALKRAQEVQAKLKNKGDFSELAKQYSDDPGSMYSGGLYADANVNLWVPEFKKAAIELPIGTLSEPVETVHGYHIIQVDSRSVQTVEQARSELQYQLFNEKLRSIVQNELPGMLENIEAGQ